MRSRHRISVRIVIAALVATPIFSADKAPGDPADKAAFEEVCGACHPATMVTDLRSEAEWKETVEHMVAIGATGTEEQLTRVLRFLLRTLTKVNVNTATAGQLAPVLDLSEAAAQAVVKYRGEHGAFKTLEDLKRVPGVDPAKLDARKDRVAF